ncbi:hypothetical protein K439DRAFT_1361020, partial [Ramaria rubella]
MTHSKNKTVRLHKQRFHDKQIPQLNAETLHHNEPFPPLPKSRDSSNHIIRGFVETTDMKSQIHKVGCHVCGTLTKLSNAILATDAQVDWSILDQKGQGITVKERKQATDECYKWKGPVLDKSCAHVCPDCLSKLKKRTVPLMSLANGNWIGQVPIQLRGLSYTEKLLIARVRKNYCVVRVESGFFKMQANAVLFPNPTPKIYQALPPHRNELDEILALIFTGPTKPTEKELRRTPLLVHSNKVHEALNWLKCNHKDYFDLDISIHNLNSYKDNEITFTIEYHQSHSNKHAQSKSIHDCEPEEGTAEGECPFVVNGITG